MMSAKNLALIERFYAAMRQRPDDESWSAGYLAEAVNYTIIVAKPTPIHQTFCDRREVATYLAFIFQDYHVVESTPPRLAASNGMVIVQGGEVAYRQTAKEFVYARWLAVYELKNKRIEKVWMSIHGWTVLAERVERTWSTTPDGLTAVDATLAAGRSAALAIAS